MKYDDKPYIVKVWLVGQGTPIHTEQFKCKHIITDDVVRTACSLAHAYAKSVRKEGFRDSNNCHYPSSRVQKIEVVACKWTLKEVG